MTDIINYNTHAFIRSFDIRDDKEDIKPKELVQKLAILYKIPFYESKMIKIKKETIQIVNGKILQPVVTLRDSESYFEIIYFNKITPDIKDCYVSFTETEIVFKRCHKLSIKHNCLTRLKIREGNAISITPDIYYKLIIPDYFISDAQIEIIWIGYSD